MLASIGAFFSVVWPWLFGAICFVGGIALCMLLIWLFLGRKKNGEDKSVGVIDLLSVFRNGSNRR